MDTYTGDSPQATYYCMRRKTYCWYCNALGGCESTACALEVYTVTTAHTPAEKHGKWVIQSKDKGFSGTQCSCCGFVWSEEIVAVKLSPIFSRIFTPFCPNCGARMEDEE